MTIKKDNFLKSKSIKKIAWGDLLPYIDISHIESLQKRKEYVDWVCMELVQIVEEFFSSNKATERFAYFMNIIFKTKKFNNLLRKYVTGYLYNLFLVLDYHYFEKPFNYKLELEYNPLNQFAIAKYKSKFNICPKICWKTQPNLPIKLLIIFFHSFKSLFYGFKNGVFIFKNRKKYKVLRQLTCGFKGINGSFLHDDFMVDGSRIKPEELLIFTRGTPKDSYKIKIYETLQNSTYDSFDIEALPVSLNILLSRIIPKYSFSGCLALLICVKSSLFSLFSSIFFRFMFIGILHEKVFSNYKIYSQLGHQYYSYDHIVEAIICNNHDAKYYLFQIPDNSVIENKHLMPFLGCDKLFTWGVAHNFVKPGNSDVYLNTGYIFKRFINQIRLDRNQITSQMKLLDKRKNIVFFEEDFGGVNKNTAEIYMNYWEVIFGLWQRIKNEINIIVKPKDPSAYLGLPDNMKNRYLEIVGILSKSKNFKFLGFKEWAFIELIGIADIVLSLGMTSSSTIAIICGINGLYFNQANYYHPLATLFKDKVVFDDKNMLLDMIESIVSERCSVFDVIPEETIREFDRYKDDRGIDLFRKILSGEDSLLN